MTKKVTKEAKLAGQIKEATKELKAAEAASVKAGKAENKALEKLNKLMAKLPVESALP